MNVKPITNIIPGNGNGGVVPPWLQGNRNVILPMPVPTPVEPPYGLEVIGGPVKVDPTTPVIM